MRRKTILVALFAMTITALIGCSGGGTPDTNPTPSPSPTPGGSTFRTILTGTGNSVTLTTRKWYVLSLRPNSFFKGTGGDQPCPVTIDSKDGASEASCSSKDYVEFRSDSTLREGTDGGAADAFGGSWGLASNTLTIVVGTGGERVETKFTLLEESAVGGKRRLRFVTISKTQEGSSSLDPQQPGNEFVLEEVL
ncbi:hypothetical protein [Armatimonas sp.]|uniref:hypothetical protein n=1 Tax=Armatimonas sp. TaxID=1872638 RepID=UPI00286C6D15|nr:hypothetical protein [Armatimonas sp.]